MIFQTDFNRNTHFAAWFAPFFWKYVVKKAFSKWRCSAQSPLLPWREAKSSKCMHCPWPRKKPFFDDKSWTRTRFVFANKNDGFSKVTRFKAFGENHDVRMQCIDENNAHHAGETHNNSPVFGAYGFTCTGMRFLMVKITNVSFTTEKVTSFWTRVDIQGWHR